MSGITWPEEIPDGAWGVRHLGCRQTFPARTEDELEALCDGAGKLVCWACEDDAPGSGYGFAPVKQPRVTDLLPEPLGTAYTPIPRALVDHGHLLRLTANERLLIYAIWRHGYGGRAFPTREQLARETGLSVTTVSRTIAGLEDERRPALLTVRRDRRAGRQQANEYDLTLLWEALAALADATAGQSDPRDNRSGSLPEDPRAAEPTAGQSDPRPRVNLTRGPRVNLTPQVDPDEGEPDEVEPADAGSATADTITAVPLSEERIYDVLIDDCDDLSPGAAALRERMRRYAARKAAA